MNDQFRKTAEKLHKEYLRKKRWKKAVYAMGCMVVFCTTYALILPAITLQQKPICGYEEHLHGEECYIPAPTVELICTAETLGVHEHDDDCYDEENNLICGQADFIIHEHDDNCYWEDELLLCTLDEVEEHSHRSRCYNVYDELICGEEETGHFHGETCFANERGELVCGEEESEGHSHSGGCYEYTTVTKTSLVCDSEEEGHSHDDGCYETTEFEERELICTEKEYKGHSHKDNCYEWNKYLTCTREEVDGHIHDEGCYVTVEELDCDKEEVEAHKHGDRCDDCEKLEILEHQHDEACFRQLAEEEIGDHILVCKEKEHQHTDACYPKKTELIFVCELQEHSHREDCYDGEGNLVCEREEHSHDDGCYEEIEIGGIFDDSDDTEKGQPNDEDESEEEVSQEPETPVVPEDTETPAAPEDTETPVVPEDTETPVVPEDTEKPIVSEDTTEPEESENIDEITASGSNSGNHSSNKEHDKPDPPVTDEKVTNDSQKEPDAEKEDVLPKEEEKPSDTVVEPEEEEKVTEEKQETPVFPVFPEEEPVKEPEVNINGIQKHEHTEGCYDEENNLICTIQDVIAGEQEEITKEELEQIEIPTLTEFAEQANMENYLAAQFGTLRFHILRTDGLPLHQDENDIFSVETGVEYQLHMGIFAPEGFVEGSYVYHLPEGIIPVAGSGTLMIEDVEIGTWKVAESEYIILFMNEEAKKFWDVSVSIDFEFCFEPGVEECQIGDLAFAVETIIDISDRILSASVSSADITVVVPEGVSIPEGAYLDVTELPKDSREWEAAVSTAEETYEDGVLDGYIYEILICDADGHELTELNMEELEISIVMREKRDFNVMYQPVQIFTENNDKADTEAEELTTEGTAEEESATEEPVVDESEADESELTESAFATFFMTAWAMETESVLEAELVDDADMIGEEDTVAMTFSSTARTVAVVQVNSPRSYQINEQKDAFTKDPAYKEYYNKNSPLGTAGSFHIVAFDTANLGTHTNGNVLAYRLIANSNFGTNNYKEELTYAQHYDTINSGSAAGTTDDILVIGSSNTVATQDNGNALAVNGAKIDRPYAIVQDANTATAPFIDLERVEREINGLSATLAGYATTNGTLVWDFSDQNNRYIELKNPDAVGILNISGSELNQYANNEMDMRGFRSGHDGSIVINVDCSGLDIVTIPKEAKVWVDGQEQSANEVIEFSAGKVVWNFINAEGVTINTGLMTGMVLAPGATVNIMQNLNGTVVAENVYVKAESHRTDFTGKIIHTTTRFSIQKVDSENISITLPDAVFDLYKWDGSKYVKVNTDPNQYTSAANGLISFPDLEYNTAYKLVETTSPIGYIIGDEPYYIILEHSDTNSYPVCKPDDFKGSDPGSLLYVRNEASDGNYELPSTGGMGTHWFILGGLAMMLGAGTLIIKTQRRKGEKNS